MSLEDFKPESVGFWSLGSFHCASAPSLVEAMGHYSASQHWAPAGFQSCPWGCLETAANQSYTVPALMELSQVHLQETDLRSGLGAKDFWEAWGLFEDGCLPLSLLKSVLGHCSPGHLGQCWQEESFSSNMAGRVPDHKAGPGGGQKDVRRVLVP